GRPHEGEELALLDGHVQAIEYRQLLAVTVIDLGDSSHFDQRGHVYSYRSVFSGIFTRSPSDRSSGGSTISLSPPARPLRTSRSPAMTGPASIARRTARPSTTSQTMSWPPSFRTAPEGTNTRGGCATAGSAPSSSRNVTRAPISGRMRGSWLSMATRTSTVAFCRSAVGTTWRTWPGNRSIG